MAYMAHVKKPRGRLSTLTCPVGGPEHGPLYTTPEGYICVHQEHDGRPTTHPRGAAPATQFRFTYNQVQNPEGEPE